MSQEDEAVLRKSLDAVDRHQRRVAWGVAVATILLIAGFFHLHAGQMADVRSAVAAAMVILAFWTAGLTLVTVLQVSAATKRILRAIDVAARPRD